MAKTANPFNTGFDYTGFAKFFDPAKFDFEQFASAFKVPSVDTNIVLEAQRRNVEAFTAANKIALEAVQTVARRQAEFAREVMQEAGEAVTAINGAKTVEERMAKQAEAVKSAYTKSFDGFRELSELGAKSSQEAADVLNARVAEGLDELGKQVKQVKKVS